MADKQLELIDKPLHPNAVEIARESVDDYAASLIVLAKTLAYQRGDDEVLSIHVLEALNVLQNRRRRKRWKDFLLAIGGALFGAFVSGFTTELSTGHSKLLLAVYVRSNNAFGPKCRKLPQRPAAISRLLRASFSACI